VVEDTVAQCNMQLEVLAKKIMKNEENVDANKISQWTTEILAVSKNLVTAQAVDESSKAVVAEYVAERSNADTGAAVDDDTVAKTTKLLKERLTKRTANYNPESSREFKKIRDIVNPAARGEDDIMMMEADETEAAYKCPYTGMAFVKPMKRYHSVIFVLTLYFISFDCDICCSVNCIHHLSAESLDLMLRGKRQVKCPVSGCRGMWSKDSSSHDNAFEMRMNRFHRTHTQTQANTQSERAVY
jgi:hypothetical protein